MLPLFTIELSRNLPAVIAAVAHDNSNRSVPAWLEKLQEPEFSF
ncbi:MAG TPA: hypothetical protein VMU43_07215 [Candidatus Acidoferrum sp.]|nr:hypothetical protein [Candidatus Acidoferrum sp.]